MIEDFTQRVTREANEAIDADSWAAINGPVPNDKLFIARHEDGSKQVMFWCDDGLALPAGPRRYTLAPSMYRLEM